MKLMLHNTLSGKKEIFKPLDPQNVRLYVCGPTIYDKAHIGNARPLLVFDVLFRLLRHLYGETHVCFVRNVTDVDDKINARARERGISIHDLTQETMKIFKQDSMDLGCLPPSVEPRATEHIPQMKALISTLLRKGHAYEAEEHVLFSVASMPSYGTLSKRNLDEMVAGARVETAPYKRNPMDFVLWKPALEGEPGWESPWGFGRPGWHIECSAMSAHYLGEIFDIHGGGIDLLFPHHENERAQSCCAFGRAHMAQIWMHNGFLQVEGEKMSKSLGNFITIHSLLREKSFGNRPWLGEVLRLNMLRTHYHQPMDWTVTGLLQAKSNLDSWYHILSLGEADPDAKPQGDILDALMDDLNTPLALSKLHASLMSYQAASPQERRGASLRTQFSRTMACARMMGLLQMTPEMWKKENLRILGIDESFILQKIEARAAARLRREWVEADRIRAELADIHIVLEDVKDPTSDKMRTHWMVK